ncbi:MAG: hypothetical protein LBM99_02680 [Bacillales bacterium]|jgi:hypothetical protein|nr:hypothetical protein [Bacillales bacterium]
MKRTMLFIIAFSLINLIGCSTINNSEEIKFGFNDDIGEMTPFPFPKIGVYSSNSIYKSNESIPIEVFVGQDIYDAEGNLILHFVTSSNEYEVFKSIELKLLLKPFLDKDGTVVDNLENINLHSEGIDFKNGNYNIKHLGGGGAIEYLGTPIQINTNEEWLINEIGYVIYSFIEIEFTEEFKYLVQNSEDSKLLNDFLSSRVGLDNKFIYDLNTITIYKNDENTRLGFGDFFIV